MRLIIRHVRPLRVQLAVVAGIALSFQPCTALAESAPITSSARTTLISTTIPNPPAPAGDWKRPAIQVAPCGTAPKIDGRLDDPCWQTATHALGFSRYSGNEPVIEQTEAWICADKSHLYFAFHCLDSHPELIKASETQRDGGAYKDDYIGMQIDSQNNRRGMSRFIVTPIGTQWANIEGGTADNITWAGDWKGAAQRTATGWTAEIAIPFGLLRYPKGAKSFNILLYRKLYRETNFTVWPVLPPTITDSIISQYMPEFTGIAPPFYAPRPVFLSYVLGTAGNSGAIRQGVDIKYPLSTTMTGLATVHPDFQTVEQSVTDVNFSYNEKFINDHRPFFAEGLNFLPDSDLFYSHRIGEVDGGLKVVGKAGDTTLGLLTTAKQGVDAQNAVAFNLKKEIGVDSRIGMAFTSDDQNGQASNRVGEISGAYGWKTGLNLYAIAASHLQSWQNGAAKGAKEYVAFGSTPHPGSLGVYAEYMDISPDLVSNLGYIPETNLRGAYLKLEQSNNFGRGNIESYYGNVQYRNYQYHTGGFYRNDLSTYGSVGDRAGRRINLWIDQAVRQQDAETRFDDHVVDIGLSWNNKTLFQSAGIDDSFGRQQGKPYNYLSVYQGILLARRFSMQLSLGQLHLGDFNTTQTVATGTYRLNSVQTFGGRLVRNDKDTNVYFSFGQKARTGADLFVIIGDPNSPRTKGQVTVKWVRPY